MRSERLVNESHCHVMWSFRTLLCRSRSDNLLNSHTYFGCVNPLCQQWADCPTSGKTTLTQKQRHLTVWRREACPPLCLERAAGWVQGPGDKASHLGSLVCLLSGCKTTKRGQGGFTDLLYHAPKPLCVTSLHFHFSTSLMQIGTLR